MDTSHQGRGLQLLISGAQDHTVPDVARAAGLFADLMADRHG